jgi:hypothetical protein
LPQPATQLVSRKADSGPSAALWQSNVRNETLPRPAFERSRGDFEKLRRLAVGEDLFVTIRDTSDVRFVGGLRPRFGNYLHGVPPRFDEGASSKKSPSGFVTPIAPTALVATGDHGSPSLSIHDVII